MQVFCKSTNGNAELRCCVCGQGFVLFWDRQPLRQRTTVMSEIQETLRRQHRAADGTAAHPQGGFLAPEWSRDNERDFAATATLGRVPVLDL